MKRLLLLIGLTLIVIFNACTKKSGPTPEETVKAFVTLSSTSKDTADKKKLIESCTGDMQDAFTKMNDEQFKKAYLDRKVALKDFKVVASNIGTESAEVRYWVNVENKTGEKSATESNVREVLLLLKDGVWKIAAIRIFGTEIGRAHV